jgi:pimeloyl-ACP methyl ester carboxylesterase
MATFLLVHGAFHGSWCWERVIPALEARGHKVLAPDLPGIGGDPETLAACDLAIWGDFVAGLARKAGEPVILVGHSRGGIVIGEAAERAPEAVACLVYLTAMLVPGGETMMSTTLATGEPAPSLVITPSADGRLYHADPDSIAELLYNTTSQDDKARAVARLAPEPAAVFAAAATATPERHGRVPRAYIECSEDRVLTLAVQRAMRAALPCDPVFTLNSDHSPFYSALTPLVDALDAIALAHRPAA